MTNASGSGTSGMPKGIPKAYRPGDKTAEEIIEYIKSGARKWGADPTKKLLKKR